MVTPELQEFNFNEILKEAEETFRIIHLLDKEEQAQYAHPELKEYPLKADRCKEASKNLKLIPFEQWTTTDIGSIAYYALYAPIKRERFDEVLEEYKKFRNNHPQFEKPVKKEPLEWSEITDILLDMVRVAFRFRPLKI